MNFFKLYPRTFWVANVIELFERWAWYGLFILFANYLTGSTDAGALGFTQAEKGLMMGVGVAILYFLPLITGAVADKYGYRRVLFLSFLVYTSAFLLLPQFTSLPAYSSCMSGWPLGLPCLNRLYRPRSPRQPPTPLRPSVLAFFI